MAYKTLLTILTDPATVNLTLEAAVVMAEHEDAHLDVLSLGVDRSQIGYSYMGGVAVMAQMETERAEADAAALDGAARKRLAREDIRWAAEAAIAQMGGLGDLVSLRAGFSDLVLLPKPFGKGRNPDAEAVLESVLFDGPAPVLLIPDAGLPKIIGRRVVIAWNQGRAAMAAVRAALPLLKAAEHVSITVIDPPNHGPERSYPGGLLGEMLARHGVKAEVSVLAKTLPRISDVLLGHVRDQAADLLVMGAYDHSRLREAIFGGTTRAMLETVTIPVLLAH